MACTSCGQSTGNKFAGMSGKKSSASGGKTKAMPKNWATGPSQFGKPSVKFSFSGKKS